MIKKPLSNRINKFIEKAEKQKRYRIKGGNPLTGGKGKLSYEVFGFGDKQRKVELDDNGKPKIEKQEKKPSEMDDKELKTHFIRHGRLAENAYRHMGVSPEGFKEYGRLNDIRQQAKEEYHKRYPAKPRGWPSRKKQEEYNNATKEAPKYRKPPKLG
jgi:hypothetical protein